MDRLYRYYGTVGIIKFPEKLLTLHRWSPHDVYGRVPPILVRCPHVGLFKYINDLSSTDDEEKYLEAVYCYDDNLSLRAIEYHVMADNYKGEQLCKVVATSDIIGDTVEIFGPSEHLMTAHPDHMSLEERNRWYEFRSKYNLY